MDISLIIPTHQRLRRVMNLMSSLTKQELGSLEIEVIIVSNLPDEELKSSLSAFSHAKFPVHYCVSGTVGVNHARNTGIGRTKADYVLFLDDDVILEDTKYLQTIHGHALKHPEAAAIGGRYKLPGKINHSDKAYYTISNSWLSHGQLENQSAVHLVGGNTLYNKNILGHRLRFNENITFGGAETELNLKIFQAGLPLYLFDDVSITHVTNLTPQKLFRKAFFQGIGRAYHEQVVHPQIWKRKEIADVPERVLPAGSNWQMFWLKLLIKWFDIFFRIGYLHAKLSDFKKIRPLLVFKCALIEIFGLDPKNLISAPDQAVKYSMYPAILTKILSEIPFWRIPWFMNHVIASRLWRIPWFLKFKVYYQHQIVSTRLWLIPWFYKYKFTPWFVSLFSETWRIPWFLRWVVLIRIRAVSTMHSWKLPWFLRHRIWPIFPYIFSKIWLIPWFIRWKILPWFAFWKLPWWAIPWFIKHKILNQFWRIPWMVKWRLIPVALFVIVFTVNMFFPVNTIGLLTFYAGAWMDLERFIKKPWSN